VISPTGGIRPRIGVPKQTSVFLNESKSREGSACACLISSIATHFGRSPQPSAVEVQRHWGSDCYRAARSDQLPGIRARVPFASGLPSFLMRQYRPCCGVNGPAASCRLAQAHMIRGSPKAGDTHETDLSEPVPSGARRAEKSFLITGGRGATVRRSMHASMKQRARPDQECRLPISERRRRLKSCGTRPLGGRP